MKKEAELTPQEKQERAWTQKRIHYHNVQAKGVTVWKEQAQDVLEQKMDEAKLIQIFEPGIECDKSENKSALFDFIQQDLLIEISFFFFSFVR